MVTYSERLKTLQRFSEINKWLAGGFSALLFFSYDKISCLWLRIVEVPLAMAGISMLFAAYALFKTRADKIEQILAGKPDTDARQMLAHRIDEEEHPYPRRAERFYQLGTVLLVAYALFFFIGNEFKCKTEKNPPCCTIIEKDTIKIILDSIIREPYAPVILDDIHFGFDSSTLREESHRQLDSLVRIMTRDSLKIAEISAHTDSMGSDSYNLRLSAARAASVRRYLIGAGIAEERIVARGYGEIAPVSSNSTDSGRQRNRRAEFRYVN
ncbi:MAG: OmpA family protein [Chitinophagaceae bacterium]|nr:OmpA family protein [Chitinophagaceae bacterium]